MHVRTRKLISCSIRACDMQAQQPLFVNLNSFFSCFSMSDYLDEVFSAHVFDPWTVVERSWVILPSTIIAATSQTNQNTDKGRHQPVRCNGVCFENIPRSARVNYTDGSWRLRKLEDGGTSVLEVEKLEERPQAGQSDLTSTSSDTSSPSDSSPPRDRSSSGDSSHGSSSSSSPVIIQRPPEDLVSPVIIQRPPEDLVLCEPQPPTPHKRRKTIAPRRTYREVVAAEGNQ